MTTTSEAQSNKPGHVLELIDAATCAAERATHASQNEDTREFLDFALALMKEAWICEDGQECRKPAEVIDEVRRTGDLLDLVFEKVQAKEAS